MATKGPEAYNQFYSDIYKERWPVLFEALKNEAHKIDRPNKWADMEPTYRMDPASILAAQALDVQASDQVLDMCAAPGGKSLILCEALGPEGQLTANELSLKRRQRMQSVFKQYLPETIREQVQVTPFDGNGFGLKKKEHFDRILLDAPCSTDRGLLQKNKELETWSIKKTKNLAIRQYSLLASAFLSLKPGGRIVYSTCTISPFENDGVIEKLFKKQKGQFRVQPSPINQGEATDHGRLILPDKDQAGPIYFSIIEKEIQ